MDSFLTRLRLAGMIVAYPFHLWVRRLHDRLYLKSGFYRRWSERSEKTQIHIVILLAYLASLAAYAWFHLLGRD